MSAAYYVMQVVTLLKHRDLPPGAVPPEEQLHTLPFYLLDDWWAEGGDFAKRQEFIQKGYIRKLET